jgi:hypothetical protein
MSSSDDVGSFARSLFGHAELGDLRRRRALVAVFVQLLRSSSSCVSEVFARGKWRERAYRFFENPSICVEALIEAMGRAVGALIQRSAGYSYVVVDGSSVSVRDPYGRKELGPIGAHSRRGRGIKAMVSLALDARGLPIGLLDQRYWVRAPPEQRRTKNEKRKARAKELVVDTEQRHWLLSVLESCERGLAQKLWFVMDRECDSRGVLQALVTLGARFTIRSSTNRLLASTCKRSHKPHKLRSLLRATAVQYRSVVHLPANARRHARAAQVVVRARPVVLRLRNQGTGQVTQLAVNAVWLHEPGRRRHGEPALDWLLLTTAPIDTTQDTMAVLKSYRMRWRIEELFKTWKSGHCRIEDSMLHSAHALSKLAAMQAAHALRLERLKHIARADLDDETANQHASTEFSVDEIDYIIAMVTDEVNEAPTPGGRRQSKVQIPDPNTITVRDAVFWVARFGGFSRSKNGGLPGGIVLGRGLEQLANGARIVRVMRRLHTK